MYPVNDCDAFIYLFKIVCGKLFAFQRTCQPLMYEGNASVSSVNGRMKSTMVKKGGTARPASLRRVFYFLLKR